MAALTSEYPSHSEPSPPTKRSAALRYGVALAVSVAAIVLRASLMRSVGGRFVFIPFFPAIVLAAWYGGLGPGLLATAITGAITAYLLKTNIALVAAGGRPAEIANWLVFVVTGA